MDESPHTSEEIIGYVYPRELEGYVMLQNRKLWYYSILIRTQERMIAIKDVFEMDICLNNISKI